MKWTQNSIPLKKEMKRFFTNNNCKQQHVDDVCVVGAGPCGLLVSIILSKYGIHHTLIDRKREPTKHPQAHFINTRSMEILKDYLKSETFKNMLAASPNSENWR